jgi:hypothetical protein
MWALKKKEIISPNVIVGRWLEVELFIFLIEQPQIIDTFGIAAGKFVLELR